MKQQPSFTISTGPDTIKPATSGERPDQVFAVPRRVQDFSFTSEVANVFDDMVQRSVPFYDEIQRMAVEISADFAVPGSQLYDIGCSTGTTLEALDGFIHPDVTFVGFDNSPDMLDKARDKLSGVSEHRTLNLVNCDLNTEQPRVEDASVVILLLTLQFVRPLNRERVIRSIYEGMRHNAALILVEKVTGSHTLLNRLFINHYYDYKRRQGYSDLEISQKREALENVLIPYHDDENRKLLSEAGFAATEEFFRWYNFAGIVAVK